MFATLFGDKLPYGCYADEAHGLLANNLTLVRLAQAYGWEIPSEYRAAWNAYLASDGYEETESIIGQGELVDVAMEWLNDHTQNGIWEWDGGLFLRQDV